MRVLVTGRGSIAQRHVRHLRELVPGVEVAVVSAVDDVEESLWPCMLFGTMEAALDWDPAALVIASISSRHAHELELCLRLNLPCLVEKPLVINREQLARVRQSVEQVTPNSARVAGCNLRYLPALQKLKQALDAQAGGRVLRAYMEVGQELTQWRPSRDITTSYSADPSAGGGVIFDLVHEIDMARYLVGPLQVQSAAGGHLSNLPIQSDDVAVALLTTAQRAPVVVSLDYVSQQVVRKYVIVTLGGTFVADLIGKHVCLMDSTGVRVLTDIPEDFDISRTYKAQMTDWLTAMDNPAHKVISSFEEAVKTAQLMLDMCDAMP